MPYTDHDAVQAILADDYDADVAPSLDPFIEVANHLVVEVCLPVETYSDERLEVIERYLAAHFYAITMPRIQTTGLGQGDIEQTIQSKIDLGLNLSHYGSSAMILDTSGGLAALNARGTAKTSPNANMQRVDLVWLGRRRDSSGSEV